MVSAIIVRPWEFLRALDIVESEMAFIAGHFPSRGDYFRCQREIRDITAAVKRLRALCKGRGDDSRKRVQAIVEPEVFFGALQDIRSDLQIICQRSRKGFRSRCKWEIRNIYEIVENLLRLKATSWPRRDYG